MKGKTSVEGVCFWFACQLFAFFLKFIIALELSRLLEEVINFSLAIVKNASLI